MENLNKHLTWRSHIVGSEIWMSVQCFKESSGHLAHGLKIVSSFWVYLLVILEEFRKKNLTLAVVSAVFKSMGGDKPTSTSYDFWWGGRVNHWCILLHVRCVIAVSSVICGRTCPVWSQYYCQSSEVCSCKFLYQKSYNISHINTALQQSDTKTPQPLVFISYEPFPEVCVTLVLTTKRHWGKTQVYDSYTFCQAR